MMTPQIRKFLDSPKVEKSKYLETDLFYIRDYVMKKYLTCSLG